MRTTSNQEHAMTGEGQGLHDLIRAYNEAVYDTDRDRALKVVNDAVARGVSPEEIVFQVVIPGMDLMIKAASEGCDTSLAQHFMTSQIATEIAERMVAQFQVSPDVVGRVVIGTAVGDMHGLGKKIVAGCLRANMIEVTDLGLSVAPERFVDEAVARGADVIGVSAMMVHTARGENGALRVREILKERCLEDRIKLVVGGAPFRHDHNLYKIVGADGWAEDGLTAVKVIKDFIKKGQ
jgi:methylmalonyl-CoA mutase cobalamin-binding domain/chain